MLFEDQKIPLPLALQETDVLDQKSQYAIQTKDLVNIVDNSITGTGARFIHNNIQNPHNNITIINEKQEALREIHANDKLRQSAVDILERVRKYESKASKLFTTNWMHSDTYAGQKNVRKILTSLAAWAEDISDAESKYIQDIHARFAQLSNSPVQELAKGPIFRSIKGSQVYGLREIIKQPKLVSPLPFHPIEIKFTNTFMGASIPVTAMYTLNNLVETNSTEDILFPITATVLVLAGAAIGKSTGTSRDYKNFLTPMAKRFSEEKESQEAFQAIEMLDQLISYDAFARESKHATLPEIYEKGHHEFSAKNLVNTVQNEHIPDYVENDVDFDPSQPLVILTGPNSGGKTSYAKAIAQAQVLAQTGGYVSADWLKTTVADKIFYQVGINDTLQDDEGGFGAQFIQTRNILHSSTPASLVIIDDLIEGTTFKEKTRHAREQLYAFTQKGPTTIYVTHHYELAQEFEEQEIGNFRQVEFDGLKPTHRIKKGISTNSHADIVAKRVEFDEQAIQDHLREQGYLLATQELDDVKTYQRPIVRSTHN